MVYVDCCVFFSCPCQWYIKWFHPIPQWWTTHLREFCIISFSPRCQVLFFCKWNAEKAPCPAPPWAFNETISAWNAETYGIIWSCTTQDDLIPAVSRSDGDDVGLKNYGMPWLCYRVSCSNWSVSQKKPYQHHWAILSLYKKVRVVGTGAYNVLNSIGMLHLQLNCWPQQKKRVFSPKVVDTLNTIQTTLQTPHLQNPSTLSTKTPTLLSTKTHINALNTRFCPTGFRKTPLKVANQIISKWHVSNHGIRWAMLRNKG